MTQPFRTCFLTGMVFSLVAAVLPARAQVLYGTVVGKVEDQTGAVVAMPLGNYRNFQTLINLVPGATPGQFQNSITSTPARSLTTNINGTNRNSNDTRLDGALDIYVWLPHHTLYNPPADTIETVNISTNAFDAEQGLAGGAAINVTPKRGTNAIHGTAFAFQDNAVLRARNFFQVGEKPKPSLNIDGGTVGGPIVRNKLFFFGGWEGTRERTGFFGRYSVPTADQRAGDVSAYPGALS